MTVRVDELGRLLNRFGGRTLADVHFDKKGEPFFWLESAQGFKKKIYPFRHPDIMRTLFNGSPDGWKDIQY